MKKQRLTLIVYWILFCFSQKIQALKNYEEWTAHYTYKPEIVKVNNSLLAIGNYNGNIIVSSATNDNTFKNCTISVFPNNILSGGIKAVTLGNGKLVIVTTALRLKPSVDIISQFVIVDPRDCTANKSEEIYLMWYRTVQALVPYYDSFDVFYSFMPTVNYTAVLKMPLRYSDLGESIKLNYSLGLENEIDNLDIQTIKPYDPSERYICVLDTGKIYIKFLLPQFETIKKFAIEKPALVHVDHNSLSICYNISAKSKDKASCSFYEAHTRGNNICIHHLGPTGNRYFIRTSIISLPKFETFFAQIRPYTVNHRKGYFTGYSVQHIDAEGNVHPTDIKSFMT